MDPHLCGGGNCELGPCAGALAVTLTAEDPLWRRICRIAAQHGERPEELVGFLAGVGIREHLRKVLDCYYPEEGVR